MRRVGALVVVVAFAGCDDAAPVNAEDATAPPLSIDAALSDAAPPDAAVFRCDDGELALPGDTCSEAWACPEGWTRAAIGRACEPPPAADCPEGAFAVPDGTCTEPWLCPAGWARAADGFGCEPADPLCPGGACDDAVFDDCGEGRWGPREWPDDTYFVDPTASPAGADGSPAHPYSSLGAARVAAGRNGTIALAAGDYDEKLDIVGRMRLGGRCAARVSLRAVIVQGGEATLHDVTLTGAGERVALYVAGARVRGERVRVSGGSVLVAAVEAGGALELTDARIGPGAGNAFQVRAAELRCRRCRIDSGAAEGIVLGDGGTLTLTEGVVERTAAEATAPRVGMGIRALSGRAELTDVTLTGHRAAGLYATPGVEITARRLVVRETRPSAPDLEDGYGVALEGVRFVAEDVVLEGNHHAGLIAIGGETELTRALLRGNQPRADKGNMGAGAIFSALAQVGLRDVAFTANHAAGLLVWGAGTVATAERLVARGTLADGGGIATGVEVIVGARLALRHALIEGNAQMGLNVGANDATAELTGATIRDNGRVGAQALATGALTLTDARLSRNGWVGLLLTDADSRVEATRLAVLDTQPAPDARFGRGVGVQSGAALTVDGALIEGNRDTGVFVVGAGSAVDLRRAAIRATRPRQLDQRYGEGVALQGGATLGLADVDLRDNHGAALIAVGGAVTGARVSASGTRENEAGFGDGLYIGDGARLELDAFDVRDHATNGLVVSNAEARLARGTVSGNAVGIVRQLETALTLDGVAVAGNASDEQACAQICAERPPEPEATDPLPPVDFGEE